MEQNVTYTTIGGGRREIISIDMIYDTDSLHRPQNPWKYTQETRIIVERT